MLAVAGLTFIREQDPRSVPQKLSEMPVVASDRLPRTTASGGLLDKTSLVSAGSPQPSSPLPASSLS